MVKLVIAFLLIGSTMLNAKRAGACIPIRELSVLKKSIIGLKLDKSQKDKLVSYEETLKETIMNVKANASKNDGKLSTMFSDEKFLREKFLHLTAEQNIKISDAIATYFSKMYTMLTKKQKEKLILKFKKIEKKRSKKR